MNGLIIIYCNDYTWKWQKTQVVHRGNKGEWEDVKMCPKNTWISAMNMRVEENQGSSDDTGANGLKIRCTTYRSESKQKDITVDDGHFGEWMGFSAAKSKSFVCGA